MRYDWVSAVWDGERFAVILADPGGKGMVLTDPNGGVYQPDQDGFAGCRATTCMRSTSSHSTAPPATPRNAQVIENDPLRPKYGSRQGLSC